jgi:hypothetical protein
MDGGYVVGVCRKDGYAQLTVRASTDDLEAGACLRERAVKVRDHDQAFRLKDAVRWEGGRVFWTPRCGYPADVPLAVVEGPFEPPDPDYRPYPVA